VGGGDNELSSGEIVPVRRPVLPSTFRVPWPSFVGRCCYLPSLSMKRADWDVTGGRQYWPLVQPSSVREVMRASCAVGKDGGVEIEARGVPRPVAINHSWSAWVTNTPRSPRGADRRSVKHSTVPVDADPFGAPAHRRAPNSGCPIARRAANETEAPVDGLNDDMAPSGSPLSVLFWYCASASATFWLCYWAARFQHSSPYVVST